MKRSPRKTKRELPSIKPEPPLDVPNYIDMEEHEGYRLGEKVWFNTSIVGEKYSWGFIKKIRQQPCGKIAITVWDELKGMWRSFPALCLFKEKPRKERRSRGRE